MSLPQPTIAALRSTVDAACDNTPHGIPGAAVIVVNRDGAELFAHAAGQRGVGAAAGGEAMTLQSSFWIASCTKAVTGIACMQLVERGVLRLDDGAQVEALCPELKALRVLREDGALEDKRVAITLRMLLTHTAGLGYSFSVHRLAGWGLPAGLDEFSGSMEDIVQPLVAQPGEGWEYSVGVDWAGVVLERVTGQKLGDYMRQHIFEPLGIKDMAFLPSEEMKANLAYMNRRDPQGDLHPRNHLMRTPLVVTGEEEAAKVFHSGGAGLFARPQEYCKILATLLNKGTSPTTGATILKPETVAEMFTNQIPQFPDFGRKGMPTAKPDLTNEAPELYPNGTVPQGWGLTFMLSNGGHTGRSKSTAHWAGISNCWWWCDPEKGVAGFVAAQILPFGDMNVLKLWSDVETQVYAGLKDAQSGQL